jgi:hypothetical protein
MSLLAGRCCADYLQVLFGLHPSTVHVCSCNTCTGGSHVASILHCLRAHMKMFRIAIFTGCLNGSFLECSHPTMGGLASIPGRDILGPQLRMDGDDLNEISP